MSAPFLFVSHVTEDLAAATELVNELERRGVNCWITPRDVRAGKPYDDEIAEAIDDCMAMLLIFSEHCNESEYIRREVTVAGEARKLIIPFRIEDARPKRGLRVRLADLHWIDGFIAREQAIDALVRSVSPAPVTRGDTSNSAAIASQPIAAAPATATDKPTAPRPDEGDKPEAEAGDPDAQFAEALECMLGAAPHRYDPAGGLALVQQLASEGYAPAQHHLGLLHLRGYRVERDPEQAARLFSDAAEQGNRSALCDLGRLHERGIGVRLDKERAVVLYKEAIDRGAFWARRGVGRILRAPSEIFTPSPVEIAAADDIEDLEFSAWHTHHASEFLIHSDIPKLDQKLDDEDALIDRAKAGDPLAQFVIGYLYSETSRTAMFGKALAWFRMSAAQDFGPSQYFLGRHLRMGFGVAGNWRAATIWYERAANQGVAKAFDELAVAYEEGWSVNRNLGKAEMLFEEARTRNKSRWSIDRLENVKKKLGASGLPPPSATQEQESSGGIENYLPNDIGVDTTGWPRKQRRLLEKAEAGDAESQFQLAQSYRDGEGVPKDPPLAIDWAIKAAEQGYAPACYFLGIMYNVLHNGTWDREQAFFWTLKAAEAGNQDCFYRVGHFMENGIGTEKDIAKAVEWYRKSAAAGMMYGLCEMGRLHEHGIGVEQDHKKAFEWYRKGAQNGSSIVNCPREALGRFYEGGLGVERNLQEAANWYARSSSLNDPAKEALRRLREEHGILPEQETKTD